ncbi:MAG: hypothetical protein M3Q19_10685 [Pseudomonadota bacterium]|nr:hypothetical protein [Pseudomonadota bacterium]
MSETDVIKPVTGFWTWLVVKDGDSRGLDNILDRWLPVHIAFSAVLGWLLPLDASNIARTIALPGAAILVGLAFGWAGRSASLLQDKDFSRFIIENGPAPEGYVYSFQLAVLTVIAFIGLSLVMASGGLPLSTGSESVDTYGNRFWLFLTGSIAVRESWGIIYFVNKLTIQFYRLRQSQFETEGDEGGGQ